MKSNKITSIAALAVGCLLVLSPSLRADDSTNTPPSSTAPSAGMRGRGPTFDMIAKHLNLTDDQKTKVKPIFDALQQKRRELMQDTSLSPSDKIAKVKALHDDSAAQLKPILTDDQYAQWEKMSQPRQQHMQAGMQHDTNAPAATPPAAAPQN